MQEIVVGDVVTFVLNVGYDYTGYDNIGMKFELPGGTTLLKKSGDGVAAYDSDPATEKITYTTATTDLSAAGLWKVHPIVYQTATDADLLHGVPAAEFEVLAEFEG